MTAEPRVRAQGWLSAFARAIVARDSAAFDSLFLPDACWRDLLAFDWDTQQFWSLADLRQAMFARLDEVAPSGLQIDPRRTPPRQVDSVGLKLIEAFFLFETRFGVAQGFVKLADDPASPTGLRAQMLATQLMSLHCAPEASMETRHPRLGFDAVEPGQTWGEWRRAKQSFAQQDPQVLVIGGGHAGVAIGARLERMGVSYLIVDKTARPGDVWRQRYESLALHTVTEVNDLPYMEVPPHYPRYLSKDKWADWIEIYVKAMDLNYWSGTELLHGAFEPETRRWNVRLRLADSSIRTLRPIHLVMAVGGIGGKPRVPQLPGMESFAGKLLHSSGYATGTAFQGQDVLVVGTSTSGHDIALDLLHKGARSVTLGQRGPACVVNIAEAEELNVDYSNGAMSREEADLRRSFNGIYPLMVKRLQAHTRETERTHATLYEGLRRAGMKLTQGPDYTGWIGKLLRDLAGYYLNVGCSEAIADGRIRILPMEQVKEFVPGGAQLEDGSVRAFDSIVLATGYQSLSTEVEAMFGPEVAARVGRSIGIGEDGEPRNLCRPTGQPHLWQIFGGIIDARKSSPLLAMQIKAQLDGIAPTLVRLPTGGVAEYQPAAATA